MSETELELTRNHEADERPFWLLINLLALATFFTYLAVGVYYVTGPIGPFHALKLNSSGGTFLAAFPTWDQPEEFDDAAYNRAAVEILRTGVPRDHTGSLFLYAPVYAYFVACCYGIGGLRLLALAIPQAFVASLTCAILVAATYRIAHAKILSALVAGVLFLINLRLAMYVGYVSPTILLIFFFSLSVLAATYPSRPASLSIFVVSLLLAAGTQAGFFAVALASGLWLMIRSFRTKIRVELVAAIILLVCAGGKVVLPTLFHQDSAGSVNKTGQAVLWEANNPYYENMGFFSLWERRPGNPWTHWQMSDAEDQRYKEYLARANHHTIQAALLWIRENPCQYGKLAFVRFWTTLGPFTGMMSPRNRAISLCIWALTFPAGLYGWWLCRRSPVSQFAAVVTLTVILTSALVIVEWYLRYRFPVDLLMTAYAGVGYCSLAAIYKSYPAASSPVTGRSG